LFGESYDISLGELPNKREICIDAMISTAEDKLSIFRGEKIFDHERRIESEIDPRSISYKEYQKSTVKERDGRL
jgi:hypothetical protein